MTIKELLEKAVQIYHDTLKREWETKRGKSTIRVVAKKGTPDEADLTSKGKITIPAIHEKDLIPILKRLGLWERIKRSEIKCAVCGELITTENLSAMKKVGNEIRIICDKGSCFFDFLYQEKGEKERKN